MEDHNEGFRMVSLGALNRTDFVKFAGAGGDFNPIHHDDGHAKSAGYPSVFAMGLLTASLAARFLSDWVGIAAVRSFEVRFKGVVWPNEFLRAQGWIIDPIEGIESLARIAFEVVNDAGEVKVAGVADVLTAALAVPEGASQ